jgi:hypothetical protein
MSAGTFRDRKFKEFILGPFKSRWAKSFCQKGEGINGSFEEINGFFESGGLSQGQGGSLRAHEGYPF